MNYIYAFLCCGTICLIAEIILDNTKLTPGHITSMFVVLGSFLSFLGVYDHLIKYASIGATLPITNFGNIIYKSALEGFESGGILESLSKILQGGSLGISSAIILGFILSLFFKPKD